MRRLRLEFVLAALMVLVGAANVEDSSTAAETSAAPSAPPAAAPAWAPSMKVEPFTPRGPDAAIDPAADVAEEPFAGSPGAPRTAGSEKTSLTSGAHKGLLCSDCHASSRVQPAQGLERPVLAWSTRYTAGVPQYRVYSSKTFDALGTDISQPDGSSRMCVGCHSSGEKVSHPEHRFGPDSMAATHPVSFTYDGGLAARSRRAGLRDPNMTPSGLGNTIARDLLDSRGKMQCSSCHDAHGAGPGQKLVRFQYDKTTSAGSNFCRVCHNK
jgi:predicted CXXCH cytochrome family protein